MMLEVLKIATTLKRMLTIIRVRFRLKPKIESLLGCLWMGQEFMPISYYVFGYWKSCLESESEQTFPA